MKKNVLVFGLISGLIVSLFCAFSGYYCSKKNDFEGSMIIGYSAMLVAFSFIFVGIKNYRDKFNDGVISFGVAFQIGLFITLIASTMYVLTWIIEYYFFIPDFMDKYAAHMLKNLQESGVSQAKIDEEVLQMQQWKEWYKNPVLVALMTYMEILPVGLVISLIGALIFKRKSANPISQLAN
jgi:hypothetical protein